MLGHLLGRALVNLTKIGPTTLSALRCETVRSCEGHASIVAVAVARVAFMVITLMAMKKHIGSP